VIGTNNAEVNAPILSINAQIGFKVVWRNVDYQVTRDALDEWHTARALASDTAGAGRVGHLLEPIKAGLLDDFVGAGEDRRGIAKPSALAVCRGW
jgi:hypothetical protein